MCLRRVSSVIDVYVKNINDEIKQFKIQIKWTFINPVGWVVDQFWCWPFELQQAK